MEILKKELSEKLQKARKLFTENKELREVAKQYAIEVIGVSKIIPSRGYSVEFDGLLIEVSRNPEGGIDCSFLELECRFHN